VVAGLRHEEYWSRFSRGGHPAAFDSRIEVGGFVEDLRPLYARASVVVVPLEISAGTNIKVLEAMACGKAVVTTPRGCDGLCLTNGREAFITADWVEFSERILELIGNQTLALHLGKTARRAVEARFDWENIAGAAYKSYQELKESARADGGQINRAATALGLHDRGDRRGGVRAGPERAAVEDAERVADIEREV
jgi:glycosyltransferase involved in cell wall biosynthesis